MALVRQVTLGHLAGWCKPLPEVSDPRHGRPSGSCEASNISAPLSGSIALSADAAAIFSRSSVTHFALEDVNLYPVDGEFFAAFVAHSRQLTCLRLWGCAVHDRLAERLAAGLPSSSLKEVLIDDWRPHMTDRGVMCFADVLPKCRLETLAIEFNGVYCHGDRFDEPEWIANKDEPADQREIHITPKGLGALLRSLESSLTLRRLVVTKISTVSYV